jgi:hypothetical protein
MNCHKVRMSYSLTKQVKTLQFGQLLVGKSAFQESENSLSITLPLIVCLVDPEVRACLQWPAYSKALKQILLLSTETL